LHATLLLILISLNPLLNWNVGIKRLRVLAKQLGLTDSLVGSAHFVVNTASLDLCTLSSIIWHRLLLVLAHLVVVSLLIHLIF